MSVRSRVTAHAATVSLLLSLAACGSDDGGGRASIDWWVSPDRADAAALAQKCAGASGGDYRVTLHQLPADLDDRRTDLVRRLSTDNASIDVLSLDTTLVPEMSEAGFLAPLSRPQQASWAKDVVPAALSASAVDGELVAAPWWYDPQLLWFRGVAAERAGLDTSKPIAWEDLIAGADRLGATVQIEDVDGGGLSEWVSGLMTSAGGTVVGPDGTVTLDSEAGRTAASTIKLYRDSQVGPGPSTEAVTDFAGARGGFLLAPSSALSTPSLQALAGELGYTAYPVVKNSTAPASGSSLAITRDSGDKKLAADLITCLTSLDQQRSLVLDSGHGSPRTTTYEDSAVKKGSPTASVVAKALTTAMPVPSSPRWTSVRRAIDDTWSPLSSVTAQSTPAASQRLASAATAGELP